MRRCAALLLLAALLLPGCGASGTDPARETAADGRTLLTMGVLSTGSEARQFASLFNARSEEYKIEVTEYSYGAAAGRTPDDLIMQLAEGEGPDLLATTGTDFTSFERSLVFVELGPLLDEFADELVPGVYEALKGQHGIYGLPTGFGVWTFITSPSLVGGQESLTMDEARQYAAALGEGASVFDKWLTRSEFFKRVLGFSAGSFIDWETYTCSFDSEEFLDLLELCLTLGSCILTEAGAASGEAEAREKLLGSIKSGAALEKFADFVRSQGGDAREVYEPSLLPQAPVRLEVPAPSSGYVNHIDAMGVGLVSMHLGGGRATKESEIDLSVGLVLHKKLADAVEAGESLATIHARDEESARRAAEQLTAAYEIGPERPERPPFVRDIIR